MKVAIIGGGIGGLTTALRLHQRGIQCRIYEAVSELKPLGVGITLLPHATKELFSLGLRDAIHQTAVEMKDTCYFNGFGQFIYREPGSAEWPQYLIHRGDLQSLLLDAVEERLGHDAVLTGHRCVRFEQDARGVTLYFASRGGSLREPVRADVAVACDGINSAIRKQLFPDEGEPVYAGINMWRGVSRHAPFLSGGSHVRIGSHATGRGIVYPIRNNIDGDGRQLINWVVAVRTPTHDKNDWNKPGKLEDFYHYVAAWHFDWLDVAELIRSAELILEYPMVDRDPLPRWSHGRVTLLGDAAHPMCPRGSNGAAQAILDARALAEALARAADPVAALQNYEQERRPMTSKIVLANRTHPPDSLIDAVHERSGNRPFSRLEDVMQPQELRQTIESYKQLTGYDDQSLAKPEKT